MLKADGKSIDKLKFTISGYGDQIYFAKVICEIKNGTKIYSVILFWQFPDDFDATLYTIEFAQKCIDDGTWNVVK